MAMRHLKGPHVSAFGSGVLYVELTNGVPTRLVEEYPGKWCWTASPQDSGRVDLDTLSPIDASAFEAAWQRALRESPGIVWPQPTRADPPLARAGEMPEHEEVVTRMDLAQAYLEMGLHDDAAQQAEMALRLSANHPWAHERARQLFEQTHR